MSYGDNLQTKCAFVQATAAISKTFFDNHKKVSFFTGEVTR